MELRRTSCCGVRDFHGLAEYTPDTVMQVFRDMFPPWNQMNGAFIFFTMPNNTEMLDALVEFISENELGETTLMGPNFNPQSHRQLYMLTWQVNKTNYERWGQRLNREAEAERQRLYRQRVDAAIARTDDRLLRRGSRIVVVGHRPEGMPDRVGEAGEVTDFGPREDLFRVRVALDNGQEFFFARDQVRRETNT